MKTNFLFNSLMSGTHDWGSTLVNGSTTDRQRPLNGSTTTRWLASLICVLMLTLGVGNAWGTSTNETITFSSATSTVSGTLGTTTGVITWTSGTSCNIKQEHGSGTNVGDYRTAPRWYANNLISFIPKSSYKITQIVIYGTSGYNGSTMTFNSGCGWGTISLSTNTTTVTLSGGWDTPITLKMGSQCRPTSVKIYYTDEDLCDNIDVTDGNDVILPKGTTTYTAEDWTEQGAPTTYPTSASSGKVGDYCIIYYQAADNGTKANGLHFHAEDGYIQIEGITSNAGVDIQIVCSGTNGFSIALTGTTTLTAQSGTVNISTDNTDATLKIFKNTKNEGYVKTITISPKVSSCSNTATFAHNSPTNGTVSFSPTGPIETCSETAADRQTTMTITPNAGYTLTAFNYSTGSGTISPSNQSPGAPSTTANSAAAQAITLTFAQNANGTCTANATFSAIVPTAWNWQYNSAAIPNPINLYIGQTAALVATYTPAGNLLLNAEKNYDVVKSDGLTQVSKTYAVEHPTYTFRADAVMDDGTIVLTNHNHTSLTTTVHVHVNPLPKVSFVDIIHGYEFSDVAGTIEDNALVSNKTTPTHDEFSGSGGANTCENEHIRLVGWIESTWAEAHPNAKHSEIIGAGTGVFFEANTTINVLTYDGKIYYAVWAKLE